MDANAKADSTRLLLRSRIVAWLAIVAELAIIMPPILAEVWLWFGITIAIALSHVLILARLRRLSPGAHGRAFRRAVVWAPVLTTALTMPIALAIGMSQFAIDALLATALVSAALAVPPAAVGYAAIERSLPDNLREPDDRRWVWRPSSRQKLALLLAWPLITWVMFWVITGLGTETECSVDGSCGSGVPVTFAYFGRRGGGSSMYWNRLALDLGLFATLLPAAFLTATSRVRGVFAVYLLLVGGWITIALVENWGGVFGIRMWSHLDLLELGR